MEDHWDEPAGKKVKKSKCRVCDTYFVKRNMGHVCCSPQCDNVYRDKKEIEKEEKASKLKECRKSADRAVQKTKLVQKLQTIFNKYIRLRDKEDPCISCGESNRAFHAGHYVAVGAKYGLRFNEDNVHKQCSRCNTFLHGNLINYRKNLVKKIGIDRVEALENFVDSEKMSISQIFVDTAYYKYQVKCLEVDGKRDEDIAKIKEDSFDSCCKESTEKTYEELIKEYYESKKK